MKIVLAITIAVLINISILVIIIASGQSDLYSSAWDKGVVVVLYQDKYGTGWWVEKRHIVTAAHVVNFQSNTRVNIIHGDYESVGTVIYVNQLYDVAIVRVEREPASAYYIWSLSRKDPEKAITIFVVGYPYELYRLVGDIRKMSTMPRLAQGIVAWTHPEKKLFEFQATTDAGNSGGPIVDESGNVVGLVSFALKGEVTSLFYGTSVSAIKEALSRLNINYKVGLSTDIGGTASSARPALIAAFVGAFAAIITMLILIPVMRGNKAWARPR